MSTSPETEIVCTHCRTANPAGKRYCAHCAERLPLPLGEFFAGRYTVHAYGEGQGVARYYRAGDTEAGALTLVELRQNRGWSDDAQAYYRDRFTHEVQLLAQLQHLPAVPILYQDLTERADRLFFVLDGMPEMTLRTALEKRQRPFPPDVVIDWGIRLGEVLAHLQAQELPAPDLDLDAIGVAGHTARFPDLGIIRRVRTDGLPILPEAGGFTAPEQLAGQAEPRSALYSLAAVMAALLTNRPPPAPSPDEDVLIHMNTRVPRWLSYLVAINLSAEPYDRYAHVEDFIADLRRQQVTDTITCRACGAENRRTEIYCQECARALMQSMAECEVCGQEMPVNARFCPNCGIKVS
ncbi:MAG: zinc ribbon domain-containing protein [Anaerolineae bacterium]|nr:zinc ribbon domain-containing protein [Anaerolineae bacterium]